MQRSVASHLGLHSLLRSVSPSTYVKCGDVKTKVVFVLVTLHRIQSCKVYNFFSKENTNFFMF